jgi:hypothetical protein
MISEETVSLLIKLFEARQHIKCENCCVFYDLKEYVAVDDVCYRQKHILKEITRELKFNKNCVRYKC